MQFTVTFLHVLVVVALVWVAGGGVFLLGLLYRDLKKRKVW